jgi:predicted transcriptional regulator
MIYRSRTEIISQILEAANGGEGITKTKLMYEAFLSHDQLQEYLMLLIEDDLLSYDSTMSTFKTTEKGLTLLQSYNKIDQILKEQQI